jgi:hypothetical protein
MSNQIDLAASSGRIRTPAYEDLYGRHSTTPKRSNKSVPRRKLRIALSVLAVVGSCATGILQRQRIVAWAPAMATVYAAIRLPVNVRGLEFTNVKALLLQEGNQRILAVEGQISNIRGQKVNVPDLGVSITNSDGREVYRWVAKSPQPRLAVGEQAFFRARLNAPPEGVIGLWSDLPNPPLSRVIPLRLLIDQLSCGDWRRLFTTEPGSKACRPQKRPAQ